jgi:hypothetical protein
MLARMDTHPEEFRPRGYRWESLVAAMVAAASPEEATALTLKLNRFRMDALHERLMSELLDGTPTVVSQSQTLQSLGATSMKTALMTYRNAVSPPAGMGSALRGIFK